MGHIDYQRRKFGSLHHVFIDELQNYLPNETERKAALDYAKRNHKSALLFTEGNTWYITMPERQNPKNSAYLDYLRGSKIITGTVAIAAKEGHAFPSLKYMHGNFAPLHVASPDVEAAKKGVIQDISYGTGEHETIGSAIIIGVNNRQYDVLSADHELARAVIDVPKKINYFGSGGKPNLTNCAEFSTDFLSNAGITGLPHTSAADSLLSLFKEYASNKNSVAGGEPIEYALDLRKIFNIYSYPKGDTSAEMEALLNPKIRVRQVELSPSNPAVAVDTSELRRSFLALREKKSLKLSYFSLTQLVNVLHDLGCSVELGTLANHTISGPTQIETISEQHLDRSSQEKRRR